MEKEDGNWHLDKKVPIALLMALVIQFGATMVSIGGVKSQGEENTRRISALESQRVSERLSSLEAQVVATTLAVSKMDGKLDRLVERAK